MTKLSPETADQPTLTNYFYINTRTHFWTFLLNSGIVALASTALGTGLAALAGFAMSRIRLAMVPTLILFLFIQKYMISGATAGAVKG